MLEAPFQLLNAVANCVTSNQITLYNIFLVMCSYILPANYLLFIGRHIYYVHTYIYASYIIGYLNKQVNRLELNVC